MRPIQLCLVGLILPFGLAAPAQAQPRDCAALAGREMDDVRITTAEARH